MTTEISCNLDFKMFPFDSHVCILDLKNFVGSSWRVVLNSPKIATNDGNGYEIGGDEFEINNIARLDYNFYFKTLSSSVFEDNGIEFSLILGEKTVLNNIDICTGFV